MTEYPGKSAAVLIAEAHEAGVELSAEIQNALRSLEGLPDIRVFTPWSHAVCVVVNPDGEYLVHTMSRNPAWTGEVLAQIASRWCATHGDDLDD